MRKTSITKGSKVEFMYGTFVCRGYDGTYVWGSLTDHDGSILPNIRYTLAEVALKMHELDGHNYKVYWEE